MIIHYEGRITNAQFRRLIDLHQPWMRWVRWGMTLFLVMILLTSINVAIQNPNIVLTALTSLILPAVFLTFPWWYTYIMANAFKQKGSIYHDVISGAIDDNGVTINGEGKKASAQWSAYTHYKRDKDIILLYQGKNVFQVFTRDLFQTEGNWEAFLGMLKERFPSGKAI
jgi:hypothetical protein